MEIAGAQDARHMAIHQARGAIHLEEQALFEKCFDSHTLRALIQKETIYY